MKNIFKTFTLAAAVCLAASGANAQPWTSGGCTVTLSGGTLTVSKSASGNGAMANYSTYSDVPWYSVRSSITSLTISSGVTSIGNYAFYQCSNITGALTIPNSVTSIGNSAFRSCSGFTGALTIGNGVTSIGNQAFYNCSGFTGALTIPNSVTSIGAFAFNDCSGFTGALTIPNGVTSIGNYAFYNCSGLTGTLTIPNSVTSIGEYAFCGCSGFTAIISYRNTPPTVTNVSTFTNVNKAIPLYVPFGAMSDYASATGWSAFTNRLFIPYLDVPTVTYATYNAISGSLSVTVPAGGTPTYQWYSNSANSTTGGTLISSATGASLTIPTNLALGTHYFYCEVSISGVKMTTNAAEVAVVRFHGDCGKLDNVGGAASVKAVLDGNGVMTISGAGDMASYEDETEMPWYSVKSSITSLTIGNGVTSIGDFAFYSCTGLGTLTIGNSVTSIGGLAFYGCTNLNGALTIPNSVTSIGGQAFQNCRNFTGTLTIPNSITSISYGAFNGCRGFSALTIPNSVTSIGDYAFYNCTGFTGALTIPNSVTSIGTSAFQGCTGLTSIISYRNAPPTVANANAFANVTNKPLYVPYSAMSAYQDVSATGWKDFTNIQPIASLPTTATNVTFGAISGSLSVTVNAPLTSPTYQWYSNSNTSDTPISGETSASFTIPTDLAAGTHYFYCEVIASADTVATNAAEVEVAKAAGTFAATAALNATYTPALTLADVMLPPHYAWVAPTTALSAGSNQPFAATYTEPSGNYLPATGSITVNVAKAAGAFAPTAALNTTYTPALTLADVTLPPHYAWVAPTTTLDVSKSGQPFAATYTEPSGNYLPANGEITVNVAKATASGVSQSVNAVQGTAANLSFALTTLLPNVGGLTGVTYSPAITANANNVLGALSYTGGNTLTIPVNSTATVGQTATITVTVSSDNYADFTATITVTVISKIPATVTATAPANITYGQPLGNPSAVCADGSVFTYHYTGTLSNGSSTAYSSDSKPTLPGSYTVTATLVSDTHAGSGSAGFTIAKAALAWNADGTTSNKTYDGSTSATAATQPTLNGKVGADVVNVANGTLDFNSANAGQNIGVTASGYGVSGADAWKYSAPAAQPTFTNAEIGKRAITVTPNAGQSKRYGAANPDFTYTPSEALIAGNSFSGALACEGVNVGVYPFTLGTLSAGNNYTLTLAGSVTFEIIKAAAPTGVPKTEYVVAGYAHSYEFNLTTLLPSIAGLTGVAYSPAVAENASGVLGALAYTGGGMLTIPVNNVAAELTATITVTVSSHNYEDFTADITVVTVNKALVEVTGITMPDGVYNGSPHGYAGTLVFTRSDNGETVTDVTFEVLYEATDGKVYSSATPPTNAGAYRLTIKVPASDANYIGDKEFGFTIAKALPSYTAPTGLTATYGDLLSSVALPEGWAWETPAALVGEAGARTHKASFTPADVDNYEIATGIDVTVTVSMPIYLATVINGTGSGSYEVGATVTIVANAAPAGQQFKEWTTASAGVTFANANSASTTFEMPANAVEVTATYEPKTTTAVEAQSIVSLKARSHNGVLYVSGLVAGKAWSVYSISGSLVYQGTAGSEEASVTLNVPTGIYVVVQGKGRVKVAR